MKSLKTSALALICFLAICVSGIAQTRQQSRTHQPEEAPVTAQVVPQDASGLFMTDSEILNLSSLYKDGHILELEKQVVQSKIDPLQSQIGQIDQQINLWRGSFNSQLESVKAAHKWGPDVVFDKNTLGFVRKAPTPAPQPKNPTGVPPTPPTARPAIPAVDAATPPSTPKPKQ